MVKSSEKMCSTGEGNGKPLHHSCLENPMNSMKKQKDRTLKGDPPPPSVGAQYTTRDGWRNNPRKKEGMEPKENKTQLWMRLVIEAKSNAVKSNVFIGTWNVRSMNQGKLEVVRQEMARVNANILGVSKLKWTGMGEFKSDDHYIYYCGQEFLRRNGVAIMVNRRVQNAILACHLKNNRMISVHFPWQTNQYRNNPSLCPDK